MQTCPHCHAATLVKTGFNPSGSQRYECKTCHRVITLEPQRNGYAPEIRAQALRLYLEGNGFRRIGRLLGVNHQTVANWVSLAAANVPPAPPQPTESAVIELDELYTFIGQKKTKSTFSPP
jgi:transposase-like protein